MILAALTDPRAYSFIAGEGDHAESLGRSIVVAQIIEAGLMTCRI